MKKKFLLLLMSCFSTAYANAQGCKIETEEDDMKGLTFMYTPRNNAIYAARVINKNDSSDKLALCIRLVTASREAYKYNGAYVKLDDGTVYKDEKVSLNRTRVGNNYDAYFSSIEINKTQYQYLLLHKVVKAELGIIEDIILPKESETLQLNLPCLIK